MTIELGKVSYDMRGSRCRARTTYLLPDGTKPLNDGSVPDSTPRDVPIKHGDIVVVDLRYKQSDKVSARTFMIN